MKRAFVDVNFNEGGTAPLILAINSGHPDRFQIIRQLVLAGADTGIGTHGRMLDFINKWKSWIPFSSLVIPTTAIELALYKDDEEAVAELQTKALEQSPFAMLPNETLKEIFKRLPKRSFVGDAAISQVCQFWHYRIKGEPRVKTPAEILASCHSREAALSILRDEGLCRHLTDDEMHSVASLVSEVAEELVKNCTHSFVSSQLAQLTRHDLSLARWIIKDVERCYNPKYIIMSVAEYHLTIATEMLIELNKYLSSWDVHFNSDILRRLGRHPEILEVILTTPAYLDILAGNHLCHLAIQHGIGLRVLNTPELLAKLGPNELDQLGSSQLILAQHILSQQELTDKLDSSTLLWWSVLYKEVKDYINSIPALRDKMEQADQATHEERLRIEKLMKEAKSIRTLMTAHPVGKYIYSVIQREVAKIPTSAPPTISG